MLAPTTRSASTGWRPLPERVMSATQMLATGLVQVGNFEPPSSIPVLNEKRMRAHLLDHTPEGMKVRSLDEVGGRIDLRLQPRPVSRLLQGSPQIDIENTDELRRLRDFRSSDDCSLKPAAIGAASLRQSDLHIVKGPGSEDAFIDVSHVAQDRAGIFKTVEAVKRAVVRQGDPFRQCLDRLACAFLKHTKEPQVGLVEPHTGRGVDRGSGRDDRSARRFCGHPEAFILSRLVRRDGGHPR